MRKTVVLTVLAAIILMAGCASMNAVPRTPEQGVYATYGLYTVVANTTADMLNNGQITEPQAIAVQTKLKTYRPVLDAAVSAVRQGNTPSAAQMQTLQAMQQWLLSYESKLQAEQGAAK